MLVKCPHCFYFKRVDDGKIPQHAKKAVCPKCHRKFDLPLKFNNVGSEELWNRQNATEHGPLKNNIKVCPDCGQRNRLPSDPDTHTIYKCGNCRQVLYTSSSVMTCPGCHKEQNTSDECSYCGIVISKYIEKQKDGKGERHNALDKDKERSRKLNHARQCIARGKAIEVIDLLGNILSIPSKILLFSRKVDSHMISSGTEAYILEFLMYHNLYDVKVRLNQYAPYDEIRRISQKNKMNILIRLYVWAFSMIAYVLNPGRLFGGDYYNPATNSVNVFSNHVGIALHELGHALDFSKRKYPGLYQLIRFIPFVALYHEYKASQYAIQFLKRKKHHEEEISAYRVLYPAYSTYVFGAIFEILPTPLMIFYYLPFIIAGHITGFIHAACRKNGLSSRIEENLGETREMVKERIKKRHFKFDITKFVAMVSGFFLGFILFNFWVSLLCAVLAYYLIHEMRNFRTAAKTV